MFIKFCVSARICIKTNITPDESKPNTICPKEKSMARDQEKETIGVSVANIRAVGEDASANSSGKLESPIQSDRRVDYKNTSDTTSTVQVISNYSLALITVRFAPTYL